MTLKVLLLEEADLSDFVEVDDAAMKDYPYAQAMNCDLPAGVDRKQLVHGEMKKHFKQDESIVWLKVVDIDADPHKMIAGALWTFQLETAESEKNDTELDASRSTANAESDRSFMAVQAKRVELFKARYTAAKAHASMNSEQLCVPRKHSAC